jgi:hypothetical protein
MAVSPILYISKISQPNGAEGLAVLTITIEDDEISVLCVVEISIDDYKELLKAEKAVREARKILRTQ